MRRRSHKKPRSHMWGCLVTMLNGGEQHWMMDGGAQDLEGNFYCPIIFTETRREIMPQVRHARLRLSYKSVKAVKVPIPELPQ